MIPGLPSQWRISTYIWLILGYPILVVVHSLACVLSWLPVFTIPVAKMNCRILTTVLLMAPEDIQIQEVEKVLKWSNVQDFSSFLSSFSDKFQLCKVTSKLKTLFYRILWARPESSYAATKLSICITTNTLSKESTFLPSVSF